jgi:hypothetical protein
MDAHRIDLMFPVQFGPEFNAEQRFKFLRSIEKAWTRTAGDYTLSAIAVESSDGNHSTFVRYASLADLAAGGVHGTTTPSRLMVTLAPDSSTAAIGHEFGHVLNRIARNPIHWD